MSKEYAVVDHYQELIDNDMCPVVGCGGPLDTGWECNRCDYDAMPWVVHKAKKKLDAAVKESRANNLH